ncbi:hypothetical protein Goklo_021541 [Gossypium klotzschianum]|uniref:Disease resistance protein At4g27190-like leucine-rich repeats domain-containing protein n=1 Tax=Gossypium klotzschianum TaxID=34286 RepID=A0A7J8UW76_9ROSI|nr:hypothetical protein [Gossypium klotzschianum]
MQNLSSLKYLDLKHSIVLEIPNGILSKLSCLQNLNVSETLVSGKEVGKLKKLEMVEGRFYDFQDLSMYLQGFHGREEPPKYIIHMGKRPFPVVILTTKGIELGDCNISNQIMLPRDIEELYAGNCTFCCHVNYPLFSRFVLTSLGTFSSLTYFEIRDVKNMKKLFSPNCVPLNLQVLKISLCVQLEEIIALDFESDERGMPTMEFSLLKLKKLVLEWLPELKSICNVDAVVVCESLKWIGVRDCPKLKRMPLKLPQLRPFSPLKLRIYVKPKEWWESAEWDDPDAKSLLKRFVNFVIW